MKTAKILSALAGVLCFAATASANDGRVSDRSLAQMGLGKMQPMTDAEGLKVRGTGLLGIGEVLRAIDRVEDRIEHLIHNLVHHHHHR